MTPTVCSENFLRIGLWIRYENFSGTWIKKNIFKEKRLSINFKLVCFQNFIQHDYLFLNGKNILVNFQVINNNVIYKWSKFLKTPILFSSYKESY